MAPLPKIDSKGLRLAKAEGALRVSSVVGIRLEPPSLWFWEVSYAPCRPGCAYIGYGPCCHEIPHL